MAVKNREHNNGNKKLIGIAGYALITYWSLCAVIYLITDICLDLYTDEDYVNVFWYAGIIVLPLAAYSVYAGRQELLTRWYTYILFPLIIYGLYAGSAYFTALNVDLLMSAAFKPTTELVTPVENVQRIFARKIGFTHTNVVLHYQQKSVIFKGTRTSYFLLKPYKTLQVKIGQSYLGNYYVSHIQLPAYKRWIARGAFIKDWFHRYLWLLIALPLLYIVSLLKDKYFPAQPVNKKPPVNPYIKYLKVLFTVLIVLLGSFMIILLLMGLFS